MKKKNIVNEEIEFYKTDQNELSLEVRVDEETIWLTQKQMSQLFQKDVRTVNEHIKNVFKEGELEEDSVIRKFRITASDGNKRIAAALFIMYLAKNNFLYSSSGQKRIADNALVALCLMIAESNPKEKETMTKVVVNLINKNN